MMRISRRAFTGGALGAAAALQLPGRALAQGPARTPAALAPALAAIRTYGEAHRSYFGLPGMTLGVTTPDGFSTVLDFGFANSEARTPITPDTLFQIGSITKELTAAVLHQLAAAGRFQLSDRISALMPELALPAGNAITVQHLLDHVAGIADDPPLFPAGGLWTAYPPAAHWHYSNTGYEMLGQLAEHVGGAPLGRLIEERIMKPLGMTRSRGAIVAADRLRYAQGYESADRNVAFARGAPLAPASWVDVTFGAGCVASTAADMNLYLRALADAAQGRGGLGLAPDRARAFTTHAVPSDTPGMNYGNGLMHVGGQDRSYLHHTGGMVSFSSSFHLDTKSGVGAFASANLSAFAEYRPRLLTRFAVDALTNAAAGRPLPATPPLAVQLSHPAIFIGRYSGPAGKFEVKAGSPLTIAADGRTAALEPIGGDMFRTLHPAFGRYTLVFDRRGGTIAGASWGPSSYARDGSGATLPASDPVLARFAGRYINDSPWFGLADVVERGGKLWIGTETPMTRLSDNLWRIGAESWSPERASFANPIDGRPQSFFLSGVEFLRRDG